MAAPLPCSSGLEFSLAYCAFHSSAHRRSYAHDSVVASRNVLLIFSEGKSLQIGVYFFETEVSDSVVLSTHILHNHVQ